jgi:hypothetical protein
VFGPHPSFFSIFFEKKMLWVRGKFGKKRQSRKYFFTACTKDPSFPQSFWRKDGSGGGKIGKEKTK